MENPRRILIIQLKRAGDVLLTTPLAALAKRTWPRAQVDFLVDKAFAPLLGNNPAIDAARVYDRDRVLRTLMQIRAQKYDAVFDFQSSPRSAAAVLASGAAYTSGYRVPFWGRSYGYAVARPGEGVTVIEGKLSLLQPVAGRIHDVPAPQVFLTPEERRWAQEQRSHIQSRTLIGLVPTHRRASRRWQIASFAALARRLEEADCGVWLFWGPGERDYVEGLQRVTPAARLIPATSLRQMAALLAQCDGVVSNDNGPMHLAAAVGVPTVTVYGPTDPRAWNPGGSRHVAIQASGVSCVGCNLNACPFGHECMLEITPEKVFEACRGFLSRAPKETLV
ncbi:MAG: hypothetical protein A2992_07680 [Elusimicrobia bacterium RIFCSPLOWO2_01_FULL_59_12]|nr:MAG: hypothetical protein A2992_07680 [Elusimicrobia bacterium RIFCSPLOWO2_01_FULL_59_12]